MIDKQQPEHEEKIEEFTCPKCGGHYFGRDIDTIGGVIVPLIIIRCCGESSGVPGRHHWIGERP